MDQKILVPLIVSESAKVTQTLAYINAIFSAIEKTNVNLTAKSPIGKDQNRWEFGNIDNSITREDETPDILFRDALENSETDNSFMHKAQPEKQIDTHYVYSDDLLILNTI